MTQIKIIFFTMLMATFMANWSSAWAQGAKEKEGQTLGIINGKYGVYQVFDCQRSPAYPSAGQLFTALNLQRPYRDVGGQYTLLAGEYIQFFYVGGTCSGGKVGIKRYNASGTEIETISTSGKIYGLEHEGFLYVSDGGVSTGYGTFVSNSMGYSYGESVSFTTTTGLADCTGLENYNPSSNPINLSPFIITGTLNAFTTTSGTASDSQTFTVSASDLTADAIVTAPASFEVSTDGTAYTSSVTLAQSAGSLTGQPVTVYVRIAASATVGSLSGDIVISSTGVDSQNISVTGTVTEIASGILNIEINQQTSTNGTVEITYDLVCNIGGVYTMNVDVSFDNGATYEPIPSTYLSGALENVVPAAGLQIIWDAKANYPEGKSSEQTKIRVYSTLN
ncbi:MAG: hypothetical protein RBR35_13740 [Salinivirgaceae bacterium]|nr:hypothetical protein [Salinivirgaceae bacterium]